MIDPHRIGCAYRIARSDLLAERDRSGHWIGELSASALSTATAISALALAGQSAPTDAASPLLARGLEWLRQHQNPDGGWGDTDRSLSNIATTMLVRAAIHLAGAAGTLSAALDRAAKYIERQGGVAGLRRRYGRDKTFAVPILTNAAMAGLVPWREVSPLPFELAVLPNQLLGLLRIPVVSYAIPALVAIGQARHFHRPPWNPIARWVRQWSVEPSLGVLQRMQPASGGFLEATPLTSFVVMSLASIGRAEHPVVQKGVDFLHASVRPDGSWPIDTNLATWGTTLAVNALAGAGEDVGRLDCLDWILSCQHRQVHPFTAAAPGGWAWTDLSGGVPDADDTPGALLALANFRRSPSLGPWERERIDAAAAAGLRWLVDLQNADGGWPTFCRGWGALPFDRSGVDLTAHALRALHAWTSTQPPHAFQPRLRGAMQKANTRGQAFLRRRQRRDGSWLPLWFGNQYHPIEENAVYGTARTLLAYRDLGLMDSEEATRGLRYLASCQSHDGGWGSRWPDAPAGSSAVSSVEETAAAVEALLGAEGDPALQPVVEQGLTWLIRAVESGAYRQAAPIGLYFAKLWYHEKLYPMIFTTAALGRAQRGNLPPPPT